MIQKILFPSDYSPSSNAALPYALSLCRESHALLMLAHVELPSLPPLGTADEENPEADEERRFRELVSRTAVAGDQVLVHEFRTLRGDPAAEIVRLAKQEQVDLIVMGSAGRTGWRRILMGSVAEAVAREAPCPVLSLREPAAASSAEPPAAELPQGQAPSLSPTEFHQAELPAIEANRSSAVALLRRATAARATDVHLDPLENDVEVRFRIDGRLHRYCRLHHDVARPLVSQLKIMAEMDIADPFHPQESRISLPDPDGDYDVRITRVPVVGGESIALRLLNRQRLLRSLDSLGLTAESLESMREMLRLGEGVVLVTGPAGSGKTTTAYSMLHALDDGRRNIVTIEDPVEYCIDGFRQMSVDSRHGVTMTSGLRTLLRMDPDIVLVGEIRDAETAEIAMRAASSGKYVFTTLHTRDVASTITALRDLHIDNRSLAGNLTGIISQRLVRRPCQHCRREVSIDEAQCGLFVDQGVEPPASLFDNLGCEQCRYLGYFERIGVFEVVLPDRAIREAIEQGAPEDELRDLLRSHGTRSLLSDGMFKVRAGDTTLEEVRSMTWVPFPA
jgi:general secretion pathway protein E